MKKGVKRLLALAIVSLAWMNLGASTLNALASGEGEKESIEVPAYDVLSWQYQREQEILVDYAQTSYTMQEPYLVVDPYEMNPLAALVMFEVNEAQTMSVTVVGDDEYATLQYEKTVQPPRAEIPVVGLYAGRANQVKLTNAQGQSVEVTIQTDALPVDFQSLTLVASKPEAMEPGMTLFIACFNHSYNAVLDHQAQVRAYLSNVNMAHGTSMIVLENGNMLSTGDEFKQIPYNMTSLWEYNWLGKIFVEYEVSNAVHHDVMELADGNFLAVSNHRNMFQSGTREDVAIIIDRETGKVVREYDFRNIIDENRKAYHHFEPDIVNPQNVDWMHMNTAMVDPDHNALIVSSPTESQVVCIDRDTEEILWILGAHEGYEGSSAFMKPFLLTPVGDALEWQWGQHQPMLLPDFDKNPDTIDLLLFDNGQSRSFTKKGAVAPADNYSRGVQYRIDYKNKTVEQIWQYGKERGSECYSTFLGDADYLEQTGNRIITYGGQLTVDGKPSDQILAGVMGETITHSRVVEMTEQKEVVFEVAVDANAYTNSAETYQAERLQLYMPASYEYTLGEVQAKRLGEPYICYPVPNMDPPVQFAGKLEVQFDRIVNEQGRLVADGAITWDGKTYMLGQAMFVLRSEEHAYVFAANSGLNGRFFFSLPMEQLEKGVYQLSIAGGVREGNDQLNGAMLKGHTPTQYLLTVE